VGGEGIAAATQILEKRPGHMQALRAQTIAAGPLTGLLRSEMRLTEALATADADIRGWKEFVRLDPGNAVSWGNLLVGYQLKYEVLLQMGRPGDAAAALRAGYEVDRLSPPSYRVKSILYLNAGLLLAPRGQPGRVSQAEEALALAKPWKAYIDANAPPGFDADLWARADDFWRLQIAQAAGEDRRVLETGPRLIAGLEKFKPSDEGQRRLLAQTLRQAYGMVAQSAYALNDYAIADSAMSKVAEARTHQPWLELGDKRDIAFEQSFQALVLARHNRQPEAQKLIAPVLAFERELSRRNHDDPSQRIELALALYAASVAGLGDAGAQLAEAGALMDNLPPEMRALRDVALWRGHINEERSRRTRP
jgi:hypothetical protein